MRNIAIIPARYASTRFPGKPLVMIDGKTMIQRVYEQALKAEILSEVIVATDDSRIHDHVLGFGGKSVMTPDTLNSGTERCAFVLQILMNQGNVTPDMVINLQGDEPYIQPSQIEVLCQCLMKPDVPIATLAKEIKDSEELFNTNVVKLIRDKDNFAIYFSRYPIPFQRNKPEAVWTEHHKYLKHIGLYGFQTQALERISKLETSPLALAESLEQLSWIENGMRIFVELTTIENQAIDTPEDLLKLKHKLP
ncbi:MAG: 3-deoxy-manno-octulosonate cytidylyltransferase [Bacteroidota bacterium]